VGRPKFKDDKKRVDVTISCRKDVVALAKKADNASRVYENSVQICQSISVLMKKLKAGKADINDVIEDISDLMSEWKSRFEEKIEFVTIAKQKKTI
jgi:ABC-type transporter Mla subunit MlaD